MLIFCLVIIWLGKKRGMQYWGWASGYIALSALTLVTSFSLGLMLFLYFSCLAYLLTFILWPLFVTPEHKEEMKKQAKQYIDDEIAENDNRLREMKEWVMVKNYQDSCDAHTFSADKAKLDEAGIQSLAKSIMGITGISVHQSYFEKACNILGVQIVDDEDATDLPDR